MEEPIALNNENVYEYTSCALDKIKEYEKLDRRMTIEYAQQLGWSKELIEWGLAGNLLKP